MTATQNGTPKTWGDVLAILDTRGPELHPVECPELGGITVQVRGLSRAEVLRIEKATTLANGKQDTAKADEMTFLWAVVEPRPSREDYQQLRQNPAASRALQRIHSRISALTGIAREAKKAQEEDDAGEDAVEAYLKSAPE
jgi:hypothetical protein